MTCSPKIDLPERKIMAFQASKFSGENASFRKAFFVWAAVLSRRLFFLENWAIESDFWGNRSGQWSEYYPFFIRIHLIKPGGFRISVFNSWYRYLCKENQLLVVNIKMWTHLTFRISKYQVPLRWWWLFYSCNSTANIWKINEPGNHDHWITPPLDISSADS